MTCHGDAVLPQQRKAGTVASSFVHALFAVAVHAVDGVLTAKRQQRGRDVGPPIHGENLEWHPKFLKLRLQRQERAQPEVDFCRSIAMLPPLSWRDDIERYRVPILQGLRERRLIRDTQITPIPAK